MIQMEMILKTYTIVLHKYLSTTSGRMLQLVLQHDAGKKLIELIGYQKTAADSDKNLIFKKGHEINSYTRQTKYKKYIKTKAKNEGIKQLKQT